MRHCTKDSRGHIVWLGDIIAMYHFLDSDGYSPDPTLDKRKWGQIWETEVTEINDDGHFVIDGSVWGHYDTLLVQKRKHIRFKFTPTDLCIGFYCDREKGAFYFCPLPMCCFIIRIPENRSGPNP